MTVYIFELGYSGAEHSEEQNGFDDMVQVRLVIGFGRTTFVSRASAVNCGWELPNPEISAFSARSTRVRMKHVVTVVFFLKREEASPPPISPVMSEAVRLYLCPSLSVNIFNAPLLQTRSVSQSLLRHSSSDSSEVPQRPQSPPHNLICYNMRRSLRRGSTVLGSGSKSSRTHQQSGELNVTPCAVSSHTSKVNFKQKKTEGTLPRRGHESRHGFSPKLKFGTNSKHGSSEGRTVHTFLLDR